MRAGVCDNFLYALEQARVVEFRFAHANTVTTELSGVSNQARGVRQCAHGHWAIVCCHTAKLFTGKQSGLSSKIPGSKRRNYPCWATANDEYVQHYLVEVFKAVSPELTVFRCQRRAIRVTGPRINKYGRTARRTAIANVSNGYIHRTTIN